MDKFLTQRLANSFPHWSKIRRDPSSVGQRFYSPLAEALAIEYATLKKQSQEFSLLRDWLPHGSLLMVQLQPADFFPAAVGSDGVVRYTFPTVTVPVLGSIELTRVNDPQDLFNSLPTMFSPGEAVPVDNWLLYDSDTGVIQKVDYACKLIVQVSGSTDYYLQERGEFTSGRYFVDIHGYDLHGNEITDRVFVRDDGDYPSGEFFSEILDVKSHGFNGRVRIYLGSSTAGIEDPMFLGADEDNVGPLSYGLGVSEGHQVLYYYTDRELFGANYRRGGEVLELENTEIWAHTILDANGNTFNAVDMAWDWHGGYLVILDDTGFIHFFDTGRANFTELSRASELTDRSYMEVQPLTSWSVRDETLKLFTRFQRPRVPVSKVRIQRISPGGTITYLQGDKTWDVGSYWWQYNTDPNITEPSQTWKDIIFEATLDEAGEWEFYCELQDPVDITITGTKVMVHEVRALGSFTLNLPPGTPERLFVGANGEFAVGMAGGDCIPLKAFRLYYYADTTNQLIWSGLALDPAGLDAIPALSITY